MNWADLNPLKRAPRNPASAKAHAWVELAPGQPFAGLARFSAESKCPYAAAAKLTGMGPEDAMAAFCGRVVDYSRLDMEAARRGALKLDVDGLRAVLR